MKKFLALFLALLMVIIPLASCNELGDLIEDEELEEEDETKKKPNKNETTESGTVDETQKNPFGDLFGGLIGTEVAEPQTSTTTGPYWETYLPTGTNPYWDTEISTWYPSTSYPTTDAPYWETESPTWYPSTSYPTTDYPYWETESPTWYPSTSYPTTDYPYVDTMAPNTTPPSTNNPYWDTDSLTMPPIYTDVVTSNPWYDDVTEVPTETDIEIEPPVEDSDRYDETDTDYTDYTDSTYTDYIDTWYDPTLTDKPVTDAPATDAPATYPPATTPPATSKPTELETNEYGEETFTSPNCYEEIGEDYDVRDEVISILVRNDITVQREWYKDDCEDEVDEVIAMRNEMVSSLLNLEVNYTLLGSSDYEECLNVFNFAIMEDVDNDFHYYDIVANYAYAGANTLIRAYIANLADTDIFPYFDFSLPCWNQSIVNTTLIDDQLYYIAGDINLSMFDKTMVVYVNKDMYNDRKASSDPDDLQDVALDGDWDFEDLYRWASVYEDSNSDTVADHEDFYGISAHFGSIPLDALPYAWDLDFLVEEADGSHSYNIEGNDKIAVAVEMARNLFSGANDYKRVPLADGVGNWNKKGECTMGGYSEPITHFANDTTIFALHLLYSSADDNVMLREMYSEFGLLPMPKFDEDQENYGTTAHDAYTLMTVIDHSASFEETKGKAISAYLQLSCEESYTNIRGYYINEIVKQKYFGLTWSLEKSQAIFDIIADNVEFTFVTIYAPQLNNVLNSCWREVITGENDLAATTAEEAFWLDEAAYEFALEDVDSWLGLI